MESTTSRFYVSIPVSNGITDCEEYYELTDEQYHEFQRDPSAVIDFVEACRRRQHDDQILQLARSNPGNPDIRLPKRPDYSPRSSRSDDPSTRSI